VSLATAGLVAASAALVGLVPGVATASSHREAPLIAADPPVDNTDVYAFVSPDAPDTVTMIANWIPLEAPGGGPNFYKFGDDVLYRINVDNDGDADDVDMAIFINVLLGVDMTPQFVSRCDLNCDGLDNDICEAIHPSSKLEGSSRQVGTTVPALLPSSTNSIAW
jgi:hypothetical protein